MDVSQGEIRINIAYVVQGDTRKTGIAWTFRISINELILTDSKVQTCGEYPCIADLAAAHDVLLEAHRKKI